MCALWEGLKRFVAIRSAPRAQLPRPKRRKARIYENSLLDLDIQKELKNVAKTGMILHFAILCEPVVYAVVALIVKRAGFDGAAKGPQPLFPFMRSSFVLLSIVMILALIFLRKILFAPERIFPSSASAREIGMLWTRSQLIVDVFAVTLATLGLALFFISGNMDFLLGLSIVSLVVSSFLFPRYEKLEEIIMTGIMKGNVLQPIGRES